MQPNDLLTISEAAKYLNVSIMTLRRWDEANKLKPSKTFGRHRKYRVQDLDDLINGKLQIKEKPEVDNRLIIGYCQSIIIRSKRRLS